MKYKLIEEKVLLEELNKIIKEMDAEIYFSFTEPAEEKVCLENINGTWTVYTYERGRKHHIKEYELLYGACIKVIDTLACTNEQSEQYIKKFEMVLRR